MYVGPLGVALVVHQFVLYASPGSSPLECSRFYVSK